MVMAEIWFLLFEGIFGAPSVFFFGVLCIHLGRMMPLLKAYRVRAVLALALVLVCSLGVLGYLVVFVVEFFELLNCKGAGCAQAGLGTFIFTPIAWLSLLLTWSVVRTVINPKFFPNMADQQEFHHA
jgi:hypothetical protein